ncbi:MAG: MmcQ/YjbR family DNA-binding protein [Clostridia bacterium]|nr:MmcQ/YjbR family DNA-binding protein [Clostridia bacterium]
MTKAVKELASLKDAVIAYVKEKYGASPENLWMRYPNYAIFRHADNGKWFALMMDVEKSKLGLPGNDVVDILNVKLSDPFLADLLVQQPGYMRGYHIARGNWISILMDGTVPRKDLYRWVDESYLATASVRQKKKMRPPKEWIIPANPKYYDIQGAFAQADEINWKQGAGIKKGDTVYMYVAVPVSAVLYKCEVTETDIPFHLEEGAVHITHLMKIRLLKTYPPDQFTFDILGKEYSIYAVRGPRGIPAKLSEALNEQMQEKR